MTGPQPGSASGWKGRVRTWSVVATAVMVAGLLASVFGAISLAGSSAEKSHRAFASSSAQIASALDAAIQHEADLSIAAGGYVIGNPDSTRAEFHQWTDSVTAFGRYPELQALGELVIVTSAQLPAFAARAVADGSPTLGADGTFHVVPPGGRPYYCLRALGQTRTAAEAVPAGLDFCAVYPALAHQDTGKLIYAPVTLGTTTLLAVADPIYRGGVVPADLTSRRTAFLGWVALEVVPQVLLDRALVGHSDTAVTFRYHVGSTNASFQAGHAPHHADHLTLTLLDGWTVETSGVVQGSGVLANLSAEVLLLGGISTTVLLAALVFVLVTGRVRALRLVEYKTEELRHQALHDALTGLPNRFLIMDRIDQLLARNRRNSTMGAALYVDLDEFKNVNDTLGHEAGDQLLQAVAARLTQSLRDADTIGRMGGDEFVVLTDGASIDSAPELVAQRILAVMSQPFEIAGAALPMSVTTSIGIAVAARQTPGELLRDADVALYQAKAAGKNCYEVFRSEMGTSLQRRQELEFDLRGAFDGGQFRLVYQPIYNLEGLTLTGVEALIRWHHPTLGEIQPDEFVPLMEASGQIIEVGSWVLHEACTQMAAWRLAGSDLMVSVNVSGRQLDRDVIVDQVHAALRESGLDPASLTIEVTETALMRDIEATARRLRELKAIGVQVAIDDFGTGYSSLAYLQRLPVDCLKIDRTFIDALTRSPEATSLMRMLIQLGRDLGLKTLAEGVETTGQLDHLRAEHVDETQGFLLAKPLDPETLEAQILIPARRGAFAPAASEALESASSGRLPQSSL